MPAEPLGTDPPELVLGPATRLLWRSPSAVHLELGSRAVVVEGLPPALVRRVASPAAPTSAPPPLTEPVRRTLAALTEAGFLWPRARADEPDPRLEAPQPRLAGQLAALAAHHGGHAVEILSARRHASIQVTGRSRVGPHIAAVLAAAGVGRVHVALDGSARLFDATPGGVAVTDEGRPLSAAAAAAVRRAAPEVDTAPLAADDRADLTILATDGPVPDERLDALHADDAPHLAVLLGIDAGVVGPLVLPGLTSCLRCADLHRRDRDPAWSALAAQLSVGRRHGPAADAALATVLAGVAAQQALTFLDGGEPATVDGTLELQLPDWRLRRRSRPVHPACPCSATRDAGG